MHMRDTKPGHLLEAALQLRSSCLHMPCTLPAPGLHTSLPKIHATFCQHFHCATGCTFPPPSCMMGPTCAHTSWKLRSSCLRISCTLPAPGLHNACSDPYQAHNASCRREAPAASCAPAACACPAQCLPRTAHESSHSTPCQQHPSGCRGAVTSCVWTSRTMIAHLLEAMLQLPAHVLHAASPRSAHGRHWPLPRPHRQMRKGSTCWKLCSSCLRMSCTVPAPGLRTNVLPQHALPATSHRLQGRCHIMCVDIENNDCSPAGSYAPAACACPACCQPQVCTWPALAPTKASLPNAEGEHLLEAVL